MFLKQKGKMEAQVISILMALKEMVNSKFWEHNVDASKYL